MTSIEQQLLEFVRSKKKNPNPDFKVGDEVYYLVHTMEYDEHHPQAKFSSRRIEAKIVKDHGDGKFDIQLIVPPFGVEDNFEGEYLFS